MSDQSDQSDVLSDIGEKKQKRVVDERFLSKDKRQVVEALMQQGQKWGKDKKRYHKDDQQSDQDSDAQEEEVIEAEIIAKNEQKKYQQDDYWDVLEENQDSQQITQLNSQNDKSIINRLAADLQVQEQKITQMSDKELQNSINSAWPEVPEIIKQIDTNQKHLKQLLKKEDSIYNQSLEKAYACYLSLLHFYLHLRMTVPIQRKHPIYQKLVDARALIKKVQEQKLQAQLVESYKQEVIQQNQMEEEKAIQNQKLLEKREKRDKKLNKKKQKQQSKQTKSRADEIDEMLRKIGNEEVAQSENNEQMPINNDYDAMDDLKNEGLLSDGEDGEDDFYKQNKEKQQNEKKQKKQRKQEVKQQQFQSLAKLQPLSTVKDDEARKINYVMLKKKSLMQRRRGTRHKNSRVKHKLRYEKALQKLKSKGQFTKTATSQFYSGEAGVKSNTIRGKKLQ